MADILIHVRDRAKVNLLLELLSSLDFVEEVGVVAEAHQEDADRKNGAEDFFSLAGIWAGRDVDINTIRKQTWPRQQP